MSHTVLILTHPQDVHADAVQSHLEAAGVAVYRTDTADLGGADAPVTSRLNGRAGVSALLGDCDLTTVGCVWHRRPSVIPADDPADAAELLAGVGGILAALPHLNHPADMATLIKPLQLVLANRLGLAVPETVISTDPAEGAALEQMVGDVVVKPMSKNVAGLVHDGDRAGWRRAMHLTQRRIDKAFDVRLTVVDDGMFAARIDSPHLDCRIDWETCAYTVIDVPDDIAWAVRRMMVERRLRYGAWDFAVDHDGTWWFLEVNPNGQWLWIEEATGLPISAAVARALASDPVLIPHLVADRGVLVL